MVDFRGKGGGHACPLKALANFSDTHTKKNMMYLIGKYHEADWIAVCPFIIIGIAVSIVLSIGERPESDDEEELLNNYRKSFNKLEQK